MLRFFGGFLFIFGFSLTICAQSGRKIAPTPTPERVPETRVEPDYSESQPLRKNAMRTPLPSLRRAPTGGDPAIQPKTDTAEQIVSEAEDEVVKVETSLITIPVSVFDRNGLYIQNLSRQDFKIFEDGVEQEIAYFGTSEKPFTVVLLLDTSPSTEFKIEEIQQAAIAFVDQLKPQDSVMVIEFDGNANVLTEPTRDRPRIHKAIRKADFGYGTSLYDTVDFALNKRLNRIEGRKAIVLFTDGVDTTSVKAYYETTVGDAEEADALIFPIYYNTFFDLVRQQNGAVGFPFPAAGSTGALSREYRLGRQYLNDLADATGGRVFNAENTPGGLVAAFEGIAEELRRQYSIGYYPQEAGAAGQRKQIKVRVNRPSLVVRARDSYIVGSGSAAAKTAPVNAPVRK